MVVGVGQTDTETVGLECKELFCHKESLVSNTSCILQ